MLARLLVILSLCTTACGDDDPERDVVARCEACLATGKSFSGGECVDTCLQDTYCFGPANPAAPVCSQDPAAYQADPF